MLGNSVNSDNDNVNVSIHNFKKNFFRSKDLSLFKYAIKKNGKGLFRIDLVTSSDFQSEDLSVRAREMMDPGTNAGGQSEMSEALSFETFHQCLGAVLLKVSRVWLCGYCNVFIREENIDRLIDLS